MVVGRKYLELSLSDSVCVYQLMKARGGGMLCVSGTGFLYVN
jgi:hypothetical protein